MSARSRRPWPVSRPTALTVAAALVAAAVAAKVPALRGGLFLLGLAAAAVGLVIYDRRQSRRRPSH